MILGVTGPFPASALWMPGRQNVYRTSYSLSASVNQLLAGQRFRLGGLLITDKTPFTDNGVHVGLAGSHVALTTSGVLWIDVLTTGNNQTG